MPVGLQDPSRDGSAEVQIIAASKTMAVDVISSQQIEHSDNTPCLTCAISHCKFVAD